MSNEYKDWIKDKNYDLCQRYPFLIPRPMWSNGEIPEDYDYSRTFLDHMPFGWSIAFGEIMCEEIRDELIRVNYLDKYRVLQVKEKYGTLRWYDNGAPSDSRIHDIIMKWEHISWYVCSRCGEIREMKESTGYWVETICSTCLSKLREKGLDFDVVNIEGDPTVLKIECYDKIKGEYERIIDCSDSWKKVVEHAAELFEFKNFGGIV